MRNKPALVRWKIAAPLPVPEIRKARVDRFDPVPSPQQRELVPHDTRHDNAAPFPFDARVLAQLGRAIVIHGEPEQC
eukprot:5217263-Pyramimonas_sp.AAC.1